MLKVISQIVKWINLYGILFLPISKEHHLFYNLHHVYAILTT